ncbi:nuclear valosin-containing protein-like isoform X2 [Halyomorpha halys]|uniref:nuclear valosin-containing protein-like isoform X2 n=1 Tax=Halyomorpha halys TaxID=286706 RepID=UPI0034D300CC
MNINSNIDPSKKEKYPFVSDRQLLSRVQQYIDTFEDPEGIDPESMVEDLRLTFKEYGRRQKSAFRGMVKRAYRIIMESRDENNTASENSESEVEIDNIDDNDEEDVPVEVGSEAQNFTVTSTPYLNSIQKIFTKQNGGTSEMQELINISSDEDEKNSNGNGRSQIPTSLKQRRSQVMAQFTKLPNVKVTPVEINKRPSPVDAYTPDPKKPKIRGTTIAPIPSVNFDSFGGFPKVLQDISELVIHIKESDIYTELGVTPPRGFLLHGPPGCGKTLLAQAVAGELKVPLVRVSGPELVAGVSGESESRIRELFDSAAARAPCILFIDEIDAISPPRDVARREMERRIVAQLLTCIDGLSEVEAGNKVIIIGATNRPDALDPALRRAGRFDREVCLGIPDRAARKQILQVLTAGIKLSPDIDLDVLAAASPGYVGADLKALMSEAAIAAVNRVLIQQKDNILLTQRPTNGEAVISTESTSTVDGNCEIIATPMIINDDNVSITSCNKKLDKVENFSCLLKHSGTLLTREQLSNLFIEMDDFTKAFKSVQPSAKREGFATVPDVTWDDIGSLKDVRSELQKSIMMPVKYVTEFEKLGITAPSGILLCGPPGCGKTLLAKAVANEANINFISVKGPELLNMYVGESERAVRQCFQRARNSQPCVIFFDEIDALCPRRSASSEGHNTRVVNQVLTEMDGIEGRKGVFLMAATNRPDMVDLAVLRPGRLDKILYVGLPSAEDRTDILKALTKDGTKPLMKDVDLEQFGRDPLLDGYTGADLAALVKEASVIALTEFINSNDKGDPHVTTDMLKIAAGNIRPSVSVKVSYISFFCCFSLIQIYQQSLVSFFFYMYYYFSFLPKLFHFYHFQ